MFGTKSAFSVLLHEGEEARVSQPAMSTFNLFMSCRPVNRSASHEADQLGPTSGCWCWHPSRPSWSACGSLVPAMQVLRQQSRRRSFARCLLTSANHWRVPSAVTLTSRDVTSCWEVKPSTVQHHSSALDGNGRQGGCLVLLACQVCGIR